MIRTCVITGYGINADLELVKAFELAGSQASRVHVRDILETPQILDNFHVLAIAGGFSFGDHLGSGKVLANLFKRRLRGPLDRFVASGKLVIGICNGFQVLVKMGFLPNLGGDWDQDVSLVHNDSGKFEDRWVTANFDSDSRCIWTRGCASMDLPVRHGEGKFIVGSPRVYELLSRERLVALRYAAPGGGCCVDYPYNPNGSHDNIAGICDRTGRIFGLMPHPEAFVIPETHPRWTRRGIPDGHGLAVFRNGVEHARSADTSHDP